MPVLNKKDRMVSFRLSGEEYNAALSSCRQNGVRSVSTFARDATLLATRIALENIRENARENVRENTRESTRETGGVSEAHMLLQLQHQVLSLRAEIDGLKAQDTQQPQPRPAFEQYAGAD